MKLLLIVGLPMAAACGFWMGRREWRVRRLLLQHIRLSVKAQVTPEQVQTQRSCADSLLLGQLYRQTGDYSRALGLHESVLANPDLSPALFDSASLAIARDYLSAGILDRAESVLLRLMNKHVHRSDVLYLLLDLYEQMKNWREAIVIAKQIKYQGDDLSHRIAHYYCELADTKTSAQVFDVLREYQYALLVDPSCIRARLSLIDWYIKKGRFQKAMGEAWLLYVSQPLWRSLVMDSLDVLYREHLSVQALMARLSQEAHYSATTLHYMVSYFLETEGLDCAIDFLGDYLPYIADLGLLDLHFSLLEQKRVSGARKNLPKWRCVVQQHVSSDPDFACKQCGADYNQMYWRCPTCATWSSVEPKIDLMTVTEVVENIQEVCVDSQG